MWHGNLFADYPDITSVFPGIIAMQTIHKSTSSLNRVRLQVCLRVGANGGWVAGWRRKVIQFRLFVLFVKRL